MKYIDAFFDFLDKRRVVRRVGFFFVLFWLTPVVLFWTIEFATASTRPGMEVAAIIASVWVPMSGLQGAVIALYNTARRRENGKAGPAGA